MASAARKRRTRKRNKQKVTVLQQFYYDIDQILRKAIMLDGKVKYLVKWPATWEPKENLKHCEELLDKFEMGFNNNVEINFNDDDDDNTDEKTFHSEWTVNKILAKRFVRGKTEYYLLWKNSWLDSKYISPRQLQAFEKNIEEENLKKFDINHNQKNDVNAKRKRDNGTDDESFYEENSAKKPREQQQQQKLTESNSKKVIALELCTKSEKRTLNSIINIGLSDNGQFTFLLKFDSGEYGLMKRDVANIKYPQQIIAFYQQIIRFD